MSEKIDTKITNNYLNDTSYGNNIETNNEYIDPELEDFTDEEAEYYNERIRKFQNGDYEGTRQVDLDAIRAKRL